MFADIKTVMSVESGEQPNNNWIILLLKMVEADVDKSLGYLVSAI